MREKIRRNIKKIICGKIFLASFFVISLCIIGLIIYLQKWEWLTLLVLFTILFICLFYKLLFGINIINIDKFKRQSKYNKYKSYINDGELYAKHLNINTFDGTGELTHPSVLYFKDGFCGYKYWMVHTPYHNCKLSLENPSVVVSNDGVNFKKIEGEKDPLLQIIDKDNPKTYYNDPNLVYTDKLEIWYRYTEEYNDKYNDHIVYRITSKDGVNWTAPEKIFIDKGEKQCHMSLSIIYEKEKYKYYYFNKNEVYFMESCDLKNWTEPKKIIINDYVGNLWHGEVKITNGEYYLLFIDRKYGIYIAKSHDGINFKDIKKINIYCKTKDYFYNNVVLYKSSFVDDGKYIYLYVPFRFDKVKLFKINNVIVNKWYITLTKVKKEDLSLYLSEII